MVSSLLIISYNNPTELIGSTVIILSCSSKLIFHSLTLLVTSFNLNSTQSI